MVLRNGLVFVMRLTLTLPYQTVRASVNVIILLTKTYSWTELVIARWLMVHVVVNAKSQHILQPRAQLYRQACTPAPSRLFIQVPCLRCYLRLAQHFILPIPLQLIYLMLEL